jgi:hypothetical protein
MLRAAAKVAQRSIVRHAVRRTAPRLHALTHRDTTKAY